MGEVEKKYELTSDAIEVDGRMLFRIRALRDFADVKAGDLGGYIEKEENLSHDENCWVSGEACVSRDARVSGSARVSGDACVSGNAQVLEKAQVYGNAEVSGDAKVSGHAMVQGRTRIYGHAWVSGNAFVRGDALVYGHATVSGDACVSGNAWIEGYAKISQSVDYATVGGFGSEYRTTTFYRQKRGIIGVQCGCFYGNLMEFREQVKKTHGDTKFAKEYLLIADLMELHFSRKSKQE